MRKFLSSLGKVLTFIASGWLLIFLWPREKRPERAFYRKDDPAVLNIAHRGGGGLAPEGTITAFEQAQALGVDMFEYDIHMTLDGHLVVIHDNTVDRITNGQGFVNELTLRDIQKLDAGYHFVDRNGDYAYRGQGVYLPTVAEMFERYPQMRHLIEIKDTNRPELYRKIVDELWVLIQEFDMEDNVMVGSFDHSIIEHFEEVTWGTIPIGAGEEEVRNFANKHIPYLNGLAPTNVDSLQLPTRAEGYDLTTKNIIQSAKKRQMAIYYWTINDEATMRELIAKGVDGIITDYPDVLRRVLTEVQAGI